MDCYQDRDVQSSVKFKCQLNFNGHLNFIEMYINWDLNLIQVYATQSRCLFFGAVVVVIVC